MNIALAHDSFTQYGGAERVMEQLHEIFPDAPVYTLVLDKKFKERYKDWDIRTSWLQVIYNFIPKFKFFLPLIPLAVRSLDLSRYDVVASSSSGFIKNIKLPKSIIHISYCHTPIRFLWSDKDYINQEVPKIFRAFVKLFLVGMRKWDFKGAQGVAHFIANSQEVQKRIQKYYQRTSTVINPGIDINFWYPTREKSDYFLLAGRLQAHKKNDLIVEIFNELDLPLHVVGIGRQEKYLKSIAKPNIKFLGAIDDEQLRDEYSGALAFIYPQIEDFGLMPLEAAACGTVTIGIAKGGSLETVVPGVTGELFEAYDKRKITQIILDWNAQKYQLDKMQNHVKKFTKIEFKKQFYSFVLGKGK